MQTVYYGLSHLLLFAYTAKRSPHSFEKWNPKFGLGDELQLGGLVDPNVVSFICVLFLQKMTLLCNLRELHRFTFSNETLSYIIWAVEISKQDVWSGCKVGAAVGASTSGSSGVLTTSRNLPELLSCDRASIRQRLLADAGLMSRRAQSDV